MSASILHIVSHTHWDREWYMPFELHRRRLVRLLDDLLVVLEADPDFVSFHLDGQMIPIQDYLEVRPEARERIRAAAAAGRLTVGPWYVLQDEFLTSAEAQVRNLMYGLAMAREFGEPLMVGYLADAFGHIGQMPTILRGFGIDNAVFGRGLKTIDASLPATLPPEERGYPSELTWRSPSGDEVLVIYMANWYANAMDLPSEAQEAADRLRQIAAACERFAVTPHLLLMNGCDHTPCQLNLTSILAGARSLLEETVKHTRLDDYVREVQAANPRLPVACGELRSEHTDGWTTLTNVLSARLYLKQSNWRCQQLLESWLEPLGAVLACAGQPVDRGQRAFLWRSLLANHPHDSICGCSLDAVHAEMETRFAKTEALAAQLVREQVTALAAQTDTSAVAEGETPIVVFNTLGFERTDRVELDVDLPADVPAQNWQVLDGAGKPAPGCQVLDGGVVWTYELPADRFRISRHVRRLHVSFEGQLPAFGASIYRLAAAGELVAPEVSSPAEAVLRNDLVQVDLLTGGRFTVTDLRTGRAWANLNDLVVGGDIGDEYIYRAPESDRDANLTDSDGWILGESPGQAIYHGKCQVPAAEPLDSAEVAVTLRVRLAATSARIDVNAEIDNRGGGCFRLRALFPTLANTTVAHADGHFEVVERPIATSSNWTNPSNCQPCLDFVDVSDNSGGVLIANRGLPEYEVLRDGQNTLAITLLRAVDRIGDWGDFPTPAAQCPGLNRADYAVLVHDGDLHTSRADLAARSFAHPLRATQTDRHHGQPAGSWLQLNPPELVLSAVRWAEDREGAIVRFYNPYGETVPADLVTTLGRGRAWLCRLDETRLEEVASEAGHLRLEVKPREVVTIEIEC